MNRIRPENGTEIEKHAAHNPDGSVEFAFDPTMIAEELH
jgi:hypothetical protein